MPDEVRTLTDSVQKILVELAEVKGMLSHLTRQGDDHETRIRKLERQVVIAAAVGMAGGTGINQVIQSIVGAG